MARAGEGQRPEKALYMYYYQKRVSMYVCIYVYVSFCRMLSATHAADVGKLAAYQPEEQSEDTNPSGLRDPT